MPSRSSSSSSSNSADEKRHNREDEEKQFQQYRESKYKNLTLQEFWALKKKERKDRVRQRNKEKREAKNKEWDDLPEEEKEKIRAGAAEKHEEKRKDQAEFIETCTKNLADPDTPNLVFDLHFATTMNLKDVKSTQNQLVLSTSSMRKERYILRPIFISGKEEEKEEEAKEKETKSENNQKHPGENIFPHLKQFDGFKKFPLQFIDGPAHKVLDPEKTTYLTADSENVLWELKPSENYVIGAFVDHNKLKGATFNYATQRNIRTARLPLDEAIKVGNRCKVLTINHVVDVLLNYAKTKDWTQALLANLPTRRVVDDDDEEKQNQQQQQLAPQRRERENDLNDDEKKTQE